MEETSKLAEDNISNGGNNEDSKVSSSEDVENSTSEQIKTDIPMDCDEDKGRRMVIKTVRKMHSQKFDLVAGNITIRDQNRRMTGNDKKTLNYFKTRLSSLKRDNDLLHKRVEFIVNENMRLLKMKPPLKLQVTRKISLVN